MEDRQQIETFDFPREEAVTRGGASEESYDYEQWVWPMHQGKNRARTESGKDVTGNYLTPALGEESIEQELLEECPAEINHRVKTDFRCYFFRGEQSIVKCFRRNGYCKATCEQEDSR